MQSFKIIQRGVYESAGVKTAGNVVITSNIKLDQERLITKIVFFLKDLLEVTERITSYTINYM